MLENNSDDKDHSQFNPIIQNGTIAAGLQKSRVTVFGQDVMAIEKRNQWECCY